MITSYAPEQKVTFKKNPHYWAADEVKLAGMEFIHVADTTAAENALRSGQIDYATVTIEQAGGLSGNLKVQNRLLSVPQSLQLCIKEGTPLGKVDVRKAVNFALDREAINQAVFGGEGEPAWDLWPEASPWHNDDLDGIYKRDVARAKRLLTAAGYPNGFTFTVTFAPAASTRIYEVMQAQLAEAGITMNLLPNAGYSQDFYLQNKYEATFSQGRPGPMDKLSRFYLSTSFANVCKYPFPQVDAAYNTLAALDPSSDAAVTEWHKIQKLIIDDQAIFPAVVFAPVTVAYDSNRIGELVLYTNQLGSASIDPVGTFIKQ
jgi:peptide/nickel transport system substrate-binding protein